MSSLLSSRLNFSHLRAAEAAPLSLLLPNAKRAVRQSEAQRDDPEANAVKGTIAGNQLDLTPTRSTSDRTAHTSAWDEKKPPTDLEQ
jgi:hypothetical protein